MKEFEKEYFSGKVSAYKGGYNKATALTKERAKLVLKYKKKGTLLDVGCAYGFFIEDVDKNFKCYGFDVSKYAIKKAKKNTKAKLYVASADKKWSLKNNFFDIITMWDIIEHLRNPEYAIKEAKRCIKKGGYIFIQTPNKPIRNLIGDKDKTHINKHNNPYWRRLFLKYNFNIIKNHTEFPRFVENKNYINKIIRSLKLPLGTNLVFVLKNEKN